MDLLPVDLGSVVEKISRVQIQAWDANVPKLERDDLRDIRALLNAKFSLRTSFTSFVGSISIYVVPI